MILQSFPSSIQATTKDDEASTTLPDPGVGLLAFRSSPLLGLHSSHTKSLLTIKKDKDGNQNLAYQPMPPIDLC